MRGCALAALGSIACVNPADSEGCSLRGFTGRCGVEFCSVEEFKAANNLTTEAAVRCKRLKATTGADVDSAIRLDD